MKTTKSFKSGSASINNVASPHHGLNKHDIDAEDEDADGENEDDDEDNGHLNTTNSPPIDSCLASHEFEWLKPSSPVIPTVQVETVDQQSQVNTSQERLNQTPTTCTSAPPHPPHHKSKKSGSHQRRSKDHDYLSCRMSPTLCYDSHNCRHRMSPMRSSWCCPSPPPPTNHAAVCLNHSGISVSGMEIVPLGQECCPEEYTYGFPCYCLPPLPGRSHIRHYSSCNCSHAGPPCVGDFSPASPQQTYRNSLQRNAQIGSRRREFSPSSSPLHRSYCSSELSHSTYPIKSTSNLWEEQWKSPLHNDDAGSFQKIQQLEADKQNLLLQTSVLNEQIEAQKEKIKELEEILEEKLNLIKELRKELHEEKIAKSAVENEKLDLLTDISTLRQQLTIADRERRESEERCRRIESELEYIAERVGCTDAEHSNRKMRANPALGMSSEAGVEIEKLRQALDSVIASNEEKDTRIEYLRTTLVKYKKLQEYVSTGHQRKLSDGVKEISSAETDGNLNFKLSSILEPHKSGSSSKCILKTCSHHSSCTETSSTSHCEADCIISRTMASCSDQKNCAPHTINRSNSLENIHASASKFTLPKCSYGTVPRQNGPQVLEQLQEQLQSYEKTKSCGVNPNVIDTVPLSNRKVGEEVMTGSRNKSTGVSFGKGFFKLRSGKRSSSAPELGDGFDMHNSDTKPFDPLSCLAFVFFCCCSYL